MACRYYAIIVLSFEAAISEFDETAQNALESQLSTLTGSTTHTVSVNSKTTLVDIELQTAVASPAAAALTVSVVRLALPDAPSASSFTGLNILKTPVVFIREGGDEADHEDEGEHAPTNPNMIELYGYGGAIALTGIPSFSLEVCAGT